MRIAVISTPIFKLGHTGVGSYSGLEQLAWLQAKGLAELGYKMSLVAPDGSECPGVEIIPCGPERQISEKAAYDRYWQHLLSVDVVIDNSWSKFSIQLKQEGRLKTPTLLVMHAPINTMIQSLPHGVDKPCFVCISEDQQQHFEALFSPAKARTTYNGVDLEIYKPIEGVKRTDRFLFLARFSSIKGADLAIEACKKAGVGLDLVGDTNITSEPAFFEKCQKMADGKQIRIIGSCSRGETVWWFSQAHCLIHSAKNFREPFGLSPVEAMACGCPVISFDRGAMRETIKHGITGWLCNDDAGLLAAIELAKPDTQNISNEMRGWCREQAAKFSVERMVKRYEELCHEAIQTGGW